jgi:OHCU decarboxylase
MGETYPRDMLGYGRRPPDPRWPGEARVAVQFVLNYEEGSENCILHGDAASEAFLSEIVGAVPWPGQRHMNMESLYEYGSRVGFWRLWRLFTERRLPLTVFGEAMALARNPDAVAAMAEAGWEIASHGLRWIDYRDVPEATERAHIAEAIRLQTALAGARPLGFYQGRTSEHTLRLTMEEGGFLYSADSYADELPYWIEGPRGPFLIVPYTLDANDMRFATAQGFNSGEQFFTYLRDAFDLLYAEGETQPSLLSVGLHCRLAGRPGRAAAVARFLDYVQGHDRAWVARRIDIARHWITHHPPPGGYRPSRLSRALFVERFGAIVEHSPWVAAAAFDAGLPADCDTAAGLAAALGAALRAAPRDRQRAVIEAHPDLAGRLAATGGLTAHSAGEQAGAGLDRLDAAERARFIALNDAYRARFGFPFILAVKGRGKAEILAAFEARLARAPDAEFAEALRQIEQIAKLRLEEML